jgi:hypothetical protein
MMLPGAFVVGVGIVTAVLRGTSGMVDVGVGSINWNGVTTVEVGITEREVGVGEVVGVLTWPRAGRDATVTEAVASRIADIERQTLRRRVGFGAFSEFRWPELGTPNRSGRGKTPFDG